MLNFLMKLITNTLCLLEVPYSHKKFKLSDFKEIEARLWDEPFAVITAITYGSGANFWIKLPSWLGLWKWPSRVHSIMSIGGGEVIEASGSEGIIRRSLFEAIGQRDEVAIFVPHKSLDISERAQKFLLEVDSKDKARAIGYDNRHELLDAKEFDCSELFFHAVNYALKCKGRYHLPAVDRFGRKTFFPVDIENSCFVEKIYDSKVGGFTHAKSNFRLNK